jgi:alpha-beta hydrolase superfamily lysophospholipase
MLRKYRRRDILLIGHSMGSIIAYDVLTQSVPDITIHTLVTMGSPLGLPPTMIKILAEQRKKPKRHLIARTPENITKAWHNFFDLEDRVATPYNLSDDYQGNTRHVRAVDAIVFNNYEYKGNPNPHNVYGYLRTPELAYVIDAFLNAGRSKPLMQLQGKIDYLLDTARWKKRGPA